MICDDNLVPVDSPRSPAHITALADDKTLVNPKTHQPIYFSLLPLAPHSKYQRLTAILPIPLHGKTPLNTPSNPPTIPKVAQVNVPKNNPTQPDAPIATTQNPLAVAPPSKLKAKTETVAVFP